MTGHRVYRASGGALASVWACMAGFFLLGVDMVVFIPGDPGKGGTAGVVMGVAAGVFMIVFSLTLGTLTGTNRIIVTSVGLTCKNNFRSRQFGWPEIEFFAVGSGRSVLGWPGLIIGLDDGSSVITNVSSFTARYPTRVARELAALQADAEAASVTTGLDTATGDLG